MAALLACGPEAVLSHFSAAALWGIQADRGAPIELSVPLAVCRHRRAIVVHRRSIGAEEVTTHRGIPVTTPACTLIDLAPRLTRAEQERAAGEADKLDLVDPERLRQRLEHTDPRPGVGRLRRTLDYRTFTMTDSETEQRFLPSFAGPGCRCR